MLRISGITVDPDANGTGVAGFSEGEFSTQTPATIVTADWLNAVQESICKAIEGKGITLASSTTQLLDAMRTPVLTTPSSIATTQDNYNPTGWSTSDIVRLTPTADCSITGFDSTVKTPRILYNVSGTYKITVPNDSGSSTAGNRVITEDNSTDFVLNPRQSCLLVYDTVSSNWRPFFSGHNPKISYDFEDGLSIKGTADIIYSGSTRSSTILVNPINGIDATIPLSWGFGAGGTVYTATDGATWAVPLPQLPTGCTITNIQVGYTVTGTPGGGNEPLLDLRRYTYDNGGGLASYTSVTSATGSAAAGTDVLTTGTIAYSYDNDLRWYSLLFTSAAGGATRTDINWVRVTFEDIGLSNR